MYHVRYSIGHCSKVRVIGETRSASDGILSVMAFLTMRIRALGVEITSYMQLDTAKKNDR